MSQINNAYVEAFLTKKPKEGIAIVQARLKDSMALDMELAEYFKERALIEENYAKSLAKASKRLYIMDPGVLGHFAPIWELLLKEFNQIATYHSEMAHKITQEIEKPLRASPSNDYEKLHQMEPLIHSLENKNKLASVRGSIFRKPSISSSLSSSSSPKSTNGTWENEGVEYLNLNQNIDEARLNRLKKSVEKFEQLQSGQLMKRVELANMTLSAAEVFDIEHDIRDFCTERGNGLVTIKPSPQQQRPKAPSTMDSYDSLRSTTSSSGAGNKFKSVFMKKKSKQQINEPQQQQQQYGYSTAGDTFNHNLNSSIISEEEPPSSNSIVSSTDHHQHQNNTTIPIATPSSNNLPFAPPTNNNAPFVDAEGYSVPTTSGNFPTIASDISSRNTSDDFDSDYQSMKLNQRLQINIQNDVVKEEDTQANESFNKMASMLRERTPTITRRARGRRESALIRSGTDFSLFNNNANDLRSNSVVSNSSNETTNSNPFMQQQHQPYANSSPVISNFSNSSPQLQQARQYTPVTLNDPPMNANNWQLQPIIEDQQQQQAAEVSFSIFEKTSMVDGQHILMVQGQISITYTGPTSNNKPITASLSQLDGIHRITPNTNYVHTTEEENKYTLNTTNFPHGQPTVCFTYQVQLNGDGRRALPIHLSPSWKCVEGTTYLMIKHCKNLNYNAPIKGNVQVFYDRVTSVRSTPQGIWDLTKKRLTWQMKDLLEQYESGEQQQGQPSRLLAKFFIEEGETATPQPVHLNYLVKGHLASGLSIRVLDNDQQLIKQHLETAVQSENIVVV